MATEMYWFVLQPNETGGTGSHQRNEIHVRRDQQGTFFPDLRGRGQTVDHVFWVFHVQRGEWGEVTYTSYGGRYVPEERLRRFPDSWKSDLIQGSVLVLVTSGPNAIAYVLDPLRQNQWPEALARIIVSPSTGAVRKNWGRAQITGP